MVLYVSGSPKLIHGTKEAPVCNAQRTNPFLLFKIKSYLPAKPRESKALFLFI